jgi:cytochrome c-type biogenesis protein CcmE
MKGRLNKRQAIALTVIIIFTIFCGFAIKDSLTPYTTFSEAVPGRTVQVKGELLGSITQEAGVLRFHLRDDNGREEAVAYRGAKPENMEHAESVVVIGRLEKGVFAASQLLVKCPSKYEEAGV